MRAHVGIELTCAVLSFTHSYTDTLSPVHTPLSAAPTPPARGFAAFWKRSLLLPLPTSYPNLPCPYLLWAAFGLGSPTRVYLYALHTQQDNRPDGGVPTYALDGFRFSPATATAATNQPPAGVEFGPVDSKRYYGSVDDNEKIKVDMFTARVEHDLKPGITLRNISRFGRNVGSNPSIYDADGPFAQPNKLRPALRQSSRPGTPLGPKSPANPQRGFVPPWARKQDGLNYDFDGEGADDERTPLVGTVRARRSRRAAGRGMYDDFYPSREPGFCSRFAGARWRAVDVRLDC